MEIKDSYGIVCICSVYEQEESFKDYRFIIKKVVEELKYTAILAPEK